MPQAKGKSVTYVTVEDFKSYQAENIRMQNLILEKLGDLETSSNVMNYQQMVTPSVPQPEPVKDTLDSLIAEFGIEEKQVRCVRIDPKRWNEFVKRQSVVTGKTHVDDGTVNAKKFVLLEKI